MSRVRILIISHDVVGEQMAGPGIRAWELAHTLATGQSVTLIAPQPIDRSSTTVRCGHFSWGEAPSLETWLAEADVVVANGALLPAHPQLARLTMPLALDLYDPTLLENLEAMRHAPSDRRMAQNRHDIAALTQQLAAADLLICATERQRDLYIGALMALGRLNPATVDDDVRLRRLIDVVPFGLPSTPPTRTGPALRGVVEGIGATDALLLWTGGLWDWMDPLTLIEAMPAVIAQVPTARLVFLAGPHPGSIQQMQMPQLAHEHAAALGLLGSHIFFYEQWVPYQQRSNFLLDADLAVSFHRDHLETAYASVRSRFLDHLWAGLPSVVGDGDAAAGLVRQHNLGATVAPGDAAGVAEAIVALLHDEQRRRICAENARALAASYTWEQVAAPLRAFCEDPWYAADRERVEIAVAVDGVSVEDDISLEVVEGEAQAPAANDHDGPQPFMPRSSSEVAAERDKRAQAQDALRNTALQAPGAGYPIAERPLRRRPFPLGLVDRLRLLVINQLVRPFVAPLIEQQNNHNAAVLRALDALAESSDLRRSEFYRDLDEQRDLISGLFEWANHLEQRTQQLERHVQQLEHRTERAEARIHGAEESVGRAWKSIATVESLIELKDRERRSIEQSIREQLADLSDADTLLAEQIVERRRTGPAGSSLPRLEAPPREL